MYNFLTTNVNSSQKYMLMSIGLATVFVMTITPSNISSDAGGVQFFGTAEMTLLDVNGDELFSQTVHNRIVDTGESLIMMGVFQNGTGLPNASSVGAICVSLESSPTVADTVTATSFDAADGLSTNNCKQGTFTNNAGGTAVLGALNFEAVTNNNNLPAGTVTWIGICQSTTSGSADYNGCLKGADGSTGILFAVIDTSDVTLASGESVDITYTFDISNDST